MNYFSSILDVAGGSLSALVSVGDLLIDQTDDGLNERGDRRPRREDHVGRSVFRTAQIAIAVWQCMQWVPPPFVAPLWAASLVFMPLTSIAIKHEAMVSDSCVLRHIGRFLDTISPLVVIAAKIASIVAATIAVSAISPMAAGLIWIALAFAHSYELLSFSTIALEPSPI